MEVVAEEALAEEEDEEEEPVAALPLKLDGGGSEPLRLQVWSRSSERDISFPAI